jgi:hypothetical protein
MTTRSALYELVDRRGLDKSTARGLWRLAGFEAQPPRLLGWLRLGLGILAAGLAGLGLVFWIAANWRSLSTFMQFALLQALVLVLYGGAAALPRARVPFSLLALVATGALFAFSARLTRPARTRGSCSRCGQRSACRSRCPPGPTAFGPPGRSSRWQESCCGITRMQGTAGASSRMRPASICWRRVARCWSLPS